MSTPDATPNDPTDQHHTDAEIVAISNRQHRRPRQAHHGHRPLSDYPELMTVAEAARYLRIATSTAYLLANLHLDGNTQACMPALRVGGRIRIVRSQLATTLSPNQD